MEGPCEAHADPHSPSPSHRLLTQLGPDTWLRGLLMNLLSWQLL